MTTTAGVRMTKEEFLAAWDRLNIGDPPALLQLGGIAGLTLADREHRLDTIMNQLGAGGLAEGTAPVRWLADHLRLTAEADYHLDLRVTGPVEPIVGLGAVAGAHGAVVVATGGGQLELRAGDATQVAPTLLGLLDPVQPGRGLPVNIPAHLLDQATAAVPDGDLWALADWLHHHGVDRAHASSLARMCTGITLGGQLGATAPHHGAPRRANWVIGFHRTHSGYFMNLRRDNTVTLCPTDRSRLAHDWRELADSVHQQAPHGSS